MTNLELTILGLLAEQPAHGYQLEQTIEERNMRDWAEIGFSSIYYILNKLEKKGWLESTQTASEGKGPGKKIYSPTPTGFAALQKALLETLSTPENQHSNFLLGLANLPSLPPQQALEALEQHRATQLETRTLMQAREGHLSVHTPHHVRAMFDLSNVLFEAEMIWLEQFIIEFRKRNNL